MTVLVGLYCKDGIVIGADSSATSSVGGRVPLMEQPTRKIDIVGDQIIVAGTGAVGLGQRFQQVVQNAYEKKLFQNGHIHIGKALSAGALQDFQQTGMNPGQYGALIAFPSSQKHHLCEFAVNDFQPEFKESDRLWYVSMGSGQMLAEPFLAFIRKVFWADELPSCQDGILAAYWALSHTIDINAGGVNGPIQIAVLRRVKGKLSASLLEEADLEEHKQNISGMEQALRDYKASMQDSGETPDLPV